jgi:hypothetical protein
MLSALLLLLLLLLLLFSCKSLLPPTSAPICEQVCARSWSGDLPVLSLVGRGARYSGVMYLSPTLEIMLERFDDADDDEDEDAVSSSIVMESNL